MAQTYPQYCPRCGSPMDAQQRLCASCGLERAMMVPQAQPDMTSAASQLPPSALAQQTPFPVRPSQSTGGSPSWPGQSPLPVGGPPSLPGQPSQPFVQQQSFPGQPSQPMGGPSSLPGQVAHYPPPIAPQQGSSPGNMAAVQPSARRRGGKRILFLVALLVVVLGAGYAAVVVAGRLHLGRSGQPPITTTALNTTLTYAGAAITVQKAQQADSFVNDNDTNADSVIRIYLQAVNKTDVPINLRYGDVARLVLSNGQEVAPTFIKSNVGLLPGASMTGIVDFPVASSVKIDQLTLRLGAPGEARMDIPLRAGADVSRYAPKTTRLSGTWQYLGLDWSLSSATTQLSLGDKQAAKNMEYVTLNLKAGSTLAQTAIPGSPFEYVRLKDGNNTLTPVDATLPVSVAAGAHDQSGNVSFLIPQNATTLTLVMLAQPQGGFDQATESFQL